MGLTNQGSIGMNSPFNPFKIPTFWCSTPLEDPLDSSHICSIDDSHLVICIPTNGWPYRRMDDRQFKHARCGHNGESPPSFCNSLGTMNIASFRGRTIDLTTRDMDSKLRYGLRKVLGTQNRPTLRLASSHCVWCLNLIKGTFNIVILNSHTC